MLEDFWYIIPSGQFLSRITTMSTITIQRFFGFEDQLSAIRKHGAAVPPAVTSGFSGFIGGFRTWKESEQTLDPSIVVILPNPSLTLALPYPRDELAVAYSVALGRRPTDSEIAVLLNRFGLSAELADRPISALSGGERLLLNLARADIFSDLATRLVLCSPTQWLNVANYRFVVDLITKYQQKQKPIEILALQGEPDLEVELFESDTPDIGVEGLKWTLRLQDLAVRFEPSRYPRFTPGMSLTYRLEDGTDLDLVSPTLLRGQNGVGKSVFSQVVSGLVRPSSGNVRIMSGGMHGKARLLMQDCILQLFAHSPLSHIRRVFQLDDERAELARQIYQDIQNQLREMVVVNSEIPPDLVGSRDEPDTVLQAKIALVAERLVSNPPVLILDEPSWCLSKPIARMFVRTVCEIAHHRRIAVIVVSHLNWWSGIANSELHMIRSDAAVITVVQQQGSRPCIIG